MDHLTELLNCLEKSGEGNSEALHSMKTIVGSMTDPSIQDFTFSFIERETHRMNYYRDTYERNKNWLTLHKPFVAEQSKLAKKPEPFKMFIDDMVSCRSSVGIKPKSKDKGLIKFSSYFIMQATLEQIQHEFVECVATLFAEIPEKGEVKKTEDKFVSKVKELKEELRKGGEDTPIAPPKNISTHVLGISYNVKSMPEVNKTKIMHYCPECLIELRDYAKEYSADKITDKTYGKKCKEHKCGLITVELDLNPYKVLITQKEHEEAASEKPPRPSRATSKPQQPKRGNLVFGTVNTGQCDKIPVVIKKEENGSEYILFLQENASEENIEADLKRIDSEKGIIL